MIVNSNQYSDTKKREIYSALQLTYEDEGNFYMALICIDSIIRIEKTAGNKLSLANAYRDKSLLHDYVGQYPRSMEASLASLDLYKEVGDKEGEANSYNDLGVLHYYDGSQETARDYFNKAFEIYKELKDTAGIAMYYNNTANTLYEEEDLEQSLEMYQKAYEYDIIINDVGGQTIALSNIGETYALMGENDKAEKAFLDALTIAEDLDDPWSLTNPLRGLGELYQTTGESHKAILVLQKSVKICEDIDAIPEQLQNYELLYELYKTKRDYKTALHYFEQFKLLDDSLSSIDKDRMMAEMEMKYQVEDKAHQIETLNQTRTIENLEHDQEINKQKNRQLYLISGLLFLLIVIIIAVRGFIQKKKVNYQLREQNTIIQNKNEQLHQAYHQIEEKNNEILDSINYAKRIQLAILPPRSRLSNLLPESFILYKPKDVVAGDFYWLELKNGKILFAAADCTGHGVPGAMVSVVCNNGLNRSVREHNLTDPGEILTKTREIVVTEFGKSEEKVNDGMDIALCCLEGNTLYYAGANNPLWIVRHGSNKVEEVKADKQPIGQFHETKPFTTHKVNLEKGDTIYVFSDGYADQFGGDKGKKMKSINFRKLIESLAGRTMNEQQSRLNDAFDEWKGEIEQLDDVCIFGVRIS